ncbi:MAG: StlD/DarB family beta-ketosynthase [Rhizobium sp.]|nr:MAG: StlD/DarB family beta-ketosynthase [Rhizobium sp.]
MDSHAYIIRAAHFLPNLPIDNDQMEKVLGQVGEKPSRARPIILRKNGIKSRYYAIDPQTRRPTHTNAQLTAEAIRRLDCEANPPAVLACGTSSPDQTAPGHANMVHGELKTPPCEVASFSGICNAGVSALKYAYLNVASGLASTSIASGSEVASSFMRAENFESECSHKVAGLDANPSLAFEKDFLRWMLSDGAGAVLIRNAPNESGHSLRIDWIDVISYAESNETCMYAGGEKMPDGSIRGYRDFPSDAIAERSLLAFKQDTKILDQGILSATRRAIASILKQRQVDANAVDYFLAHFSSEYFRKMLFDAMAAEFRIAPEKWFNNLSRVGNIGSASIYVMLSELFNTCALVPGQRILCYVPESGRFSISFLHLTVV